MLGRLKYKILHFVSGGFSGATQVAIDLCGPQSHVETRLVLRRRASVDPMPYIKKLRAGGMQVDLVPRWSHTATIRSLARICRRWNPDVLVAHGYSEHLWGRYAGLKSGVPRLMQVEHSALESYSRKRLHQSLKLAQYTERVVCVSRAVRDRLIQLGYPSDLCAVIYNGIELERWSGGRRWADRENSIVMPARLSDEKDHVTLIRALGELARDNLRPILYLAGEGKQKKEEQLRKLAHEVGVFEQIRWMGYYQELPELMGRVKLCVLATHSEGLGLGLIEGMVSGCCAVGSNVAGVSEILTDGKTGFLTPHEDFEALAHVLKQLLLDDEKAADVAIAGQRHAMREFDRRRMQRQYLELFQNPPESE